MALKILVVGDSYMPATTFRRALGALQSQHLINYVQLDEGAAFSPTTESERRIKEYTGTPVQVASHIGDAEVLIVHGAPVTASVLDAAPRLRLVACARGGPVNVDADALAERGVRLVTTPGKNAEAVAELTLAFMLMLARRTRRASDYLLAGNRAGESAFEGVEFFGHELGGRTLGLVGYGHVGAHVARRALGFGLNVCAYDPHVVIDPCTLVTQVDRLDEVLTRSDFVSLHARLAPGAPPIIGRPELEQMKRGAWLVNTARSSLVDEEALNDALTDGTLAGVGLDVLSPHRDAVHPLLRHETAVVTPHIAGATHETLARGATMLAAEIERFAAGQPLLNELDRA